MGTGFNLINKPLVGVNIIETTKKIGIPIHDKYGVRKGQR